VLIIQYCMHHKISKLYSLSRGGGAAIYLGEAKANQLDS